MNIWNEFKKIFLYLGVSVFNIYVDVYIWVSKQEYIQSLFIGVKCLEPENPEWICIDSLLWRGGKYDICNTYLQDYTDMKEEYRYFCSRKSNMGGSEHLFLAKQADGSYFSRSTQCKNESSESRKSKVEFMFVEYAHPKMGNTIELVIPEGMWRTGNVLFTPTFILRLLKHQTTSYYFDLDYKINIMDQDVQNITLSSNRFIVLEENSYIISSV
jgi:hypothetical protein